MAGGLVTDDLRTLVLASDLGGIARAAETLGRPYRTVSFQVQRLEREIGMPVYRRHVRGFTLTEAGRTLVSYGQQLLALSDEAMEMLLGGQLAGSVRLGLSPWLEAAVSPALARFHASHPRARVVATVADEAVLARALAAGGLDLTVGYAAQPAVRDATREPLAWVGGRYDAALLQLVARPSPCLLRDVAERVLAAAGILSVTRVGPSAVDALCRTVIEDEGVALVPRRILPAGAPSRRDLPEPALWLTIEVAAADGYLARRLAGQLREGLLPRSPAGADGAPLERSVRVTGTRS